MSANQKKRGENMLSVIIPAYNEEKMIQTTADTVDRILSEASVPYEIVFVNDGSKDGTWQQIETAAKKNPHVNGLHFSRNFGKESAIFAGLANAEGDCCAVMDCDLQHPAETLIEMYRKWEEGYEVIEGIKKSRGNESIIHKKCAGFFYGIMSKATKVDMQNTSDFKMMDRRVVNSILSLPERNMFFRATSSWVGYKTAYVEFEVHEREAGESKWSTGSLIKYAFTNIVAFTTAPLQFVTVGGCICFGCSLIMIIYSLIQYFRGHAIEGYTTTILLLLLIGSAIMLSLGVIGYYLAKIYEEVKRRPRYIVSQIVRGNKDVTDSVRDDA